MLASARSVLICGLVLSSHGQQYDRQVLKGFEPLQSCVEEESCWRQHSWDLMSALFNIEIFDANHPVSQRALNLVSGARRRIQDTLHQMRDVDNDDPVSEVFTRLFRRRFGFADHDPNARVPDEQINDGLVAVLEWKPTSDCRSGCPFAVLDEAVLVSWAARRVGLQLKDYALLRVLNAVLAYARNFYDEMGRDSDMDEYKDALFLAMHLIYVITDFGLTKLQEGSLVPEVMFVRESIQVAIERADFDCLGEAVDCLEVSGFSSHHDDVRNTINAGRDELYKQQRADGRWPALPGEPVDKGWVHRSYVGLLGLLSRSTERPLAPPDALENTQYWKLVRQYQTLEPTDLRSADSDIFTEL